MEVVKVKTEDGQEAFEHYCKLAMRGTACIIRRKYDENGNVTIAQEYNKDKYWYEDIKEAD